MHSDHCAKKLLPWFDGMLKADEAYFKEHQEPLFSSHMLDLSEESKEDNIAECVRYFKRMAPLGLWLEMEIGITGGEEDGVDNTGVDSSRLYTQPEDIWDVYSALSAIGPNFSIAAAFGNVHGVYKPGNVRLHPELLNKHQLYAEQKLGGQKKPLYLVFHGGSGSTKDEIKTAVQNGVVKMNVDTDTQWAYLCGIRVSPLALRHPVRRWRRWWLTFAMTYRTLFKTSRATSRPRSGTRRVPTSRTRRYAGCTTHTRTLAIPAHQVTFLQFYDPRVWVREGEKTLVERVKEACADLGNTSECPFLLAPLLSRCAITDEPTSDRL